MKRLYLYATAALLTATCLNARPNNACIAPAIIERLFELNSEMAKILTSNVGAPQVNLNTITGDLLTPTPDTDLINFNKKNHEILTPNTHLTTQNENSDNASNGDDDWDLPVLASSQRRLMEMRNKENPIRLSDDDLAEFDPLTPNSLGNEFIKRTQKQDNSRVKGQAVTRPNTAEDSTLHTSDDEYADLPIVTSRRNPDGTTEPTAHLLFD